MLAGSGYKCCPVWAAAHCSLDLDMDTYYKLILALLLLCHLHQDTLVAAKPAMDQVGVSKSVAKSRPSVLLFCCRWAACRMLSSIWMIWTSSTLPKSGRGNSIYILTSYKDGSIFKVLFLFSSDLLFTPSKKNSFSLISDSLSGNARPRFTRSVSSR